MMRRMSPVLIVLVLVNAPCRSMLPALDASQIPKWETLPHDPVAAGNSMLPLFDVVPLDAALNATDWRA